MSDRANHSYVMLAKHRKSFALLSECDPDTVGRATIFVHGFNGSADKTWTDFLSLVDKEEASSQWWERSDLYFLDYQWASVFSQPVKNTLNLYSFIRQIFPRPSKALPAANPFRDANFQYHELVLVGHSQGGLLIRKAILEAAQKDKRIGDFMRESRYRKVPEPECSGLLSAKLRLFAPALGGEMLSGLFGIACSLPVVADFLAVSAARKGMNPVSASVTETRRQTDRYAELLTLEGFRAHIVWAEKDQIVNEEKYVEDLQCPNFPPGSNHSSLCKPSLSYTLPLNFVEKGVDGDECG